MISSRWLMMVGMMGLFGVGVWGADALSGSELGKLGALWRQAQATTQTEARKRDQLALEAQSAIIRLKDAELQMERAVGAGRDACGKLGKVLVLGDEWKCEAPPPVPKEQQK